MRVLLIVSVALITAVGLSQTALAYPSWSSYRTMDDIERSRFDKSMVALVARIQPDGFKTTHIKFCAADQLLWETSLNASCASTRTAAVHQKWPPAITNENLEFSWVAHSRFAIAFCENQPDDRLCVPFGARKTKVEKTGAQESTPTRATMLTNWAALINSTLPPASAQSGKPSETCKAENDVLLTKTGATIYLDFGVQPGEKHAEALTELARATSEDKMPEAVLKDDVDTIIKIGKVLSNNARAKQPWVIARVKQDRVTWIGTEFTEKELGDRTGKRMAASFDELKAQLKAKSVVKPFARDAMTIGACPTAPACAWLHEASLRTTASLIPLASDDLKNKMTELQQDEKKQLDGLQELVTANKLSKDEYAAIEREYRNLLIAADAPDVKARNKARLRYSVPEVSKIMTALYDLAVATKKNGAERDQAVVNAAISQTGNGIFAMGTRARDTMVPLLEAACVGPVLLPAAKAAGASSAVKKPAKVPSMAKPTTN